MAKRRADKELNHDNWDEDYVPEEAGTFKRANEHSLEGRVMRKGKRRIESKDETSGKNVFAGFGSLVSTKMPSADFGFLKQFQATSNTAQSNSSPPKMTFGSSSNEDSNSKKEKPDDNYASSLIALNRGFVKWITDHVEKDPCCILTPPLEDYKKHLDDLKQECGLKKEKSESPPKSSTAVIQPFGGFKSTAVTPPSFTKPTFPFPTAANTNDKKEKPFSFLPTKPEGEKNSTPGFSFLSNTKNGTPASASSGFSFFSNMPKPAASETKEEEESDEPPKVEFTAVVEESAVYSIRCKLFFKRDGNFNDKGVGTLYLKQTDKKTQLIIRADTNLGNILLNILLQPDLPVQRMGKNNVMIMCIPNPPIDHKNPEKEPMPFLIRVKTAEDADTLKEKIEELKA